jgi:hypothetical protein
MRARDPVMDCQIGVDQESAKGIGVAAAGSPSEATNTERPAHAGPSHDHRANGSPVGTSSADRGCAAMVSVAQRK